MVTDSQVKREMQSFLEREKRRPRWDANKQELGEFEVETEPCWTGRRHIHYLFVKGKWQWVLRWGWRRSELCGTTRCREVTLIEYPKETEISVS